MAQTPANVPIYPVLPGANLRPLDPLVCVQVRDEENHTHDILFEEVTTDGELRLETRDHEGAVCMEATAGLG